MLMFVLLGRSLIKPTSPAMLPAHRISDSDSCRLVAGGIVLSIVEIVVRITMVSTETRHAKNQYCERKQH
jgi:hypothetical protein